MSFTRDKSKKDNLQIILNIIFVFFLYILLVNKVSYGSDNENNPADPIRLVDHIIRADADGLALNPIDNEIIHGDEEYNNYVNSILNKAEKLAITNFDSGKNHKRKIKILIHVHGGMNNFESTDKRVANLADKIMKEESDWHYPIFISWPSGVGSTYGEQLLRIRKGVKTEPPVSYIGVPFIGMSHMGTSIGKIPENFYHHLVNSKDIVATRIGPKGWLSHIWKQAERNSGYSFCMDEFESEEKAKILCNKIYNKYFSNIETRDQSKARRSYDKLLLKGKNDLYKKTVKVLNKTLKVPDFYELCDENENKVYSPYVKRLIEKTANYRNKRFKKLTSYERMKIRRLNRLIIEENFQYEAPKSLDVYRGEFVLTKEDKFIRYPYQFVMTPIRLTIGSFAHSTFGDASWKNMKRRTSNIFYPVYFFDNRHDEGTAAGDFFQTLIDRIKIKQDENNKNVKKFEYEITLVGHSMGAIILNKVLSKYQKEWITTKSLNNIVYMAAACSISEAKDAIIPLLERNGGPDPVKHTDFFNLTLNRVAEISEPVGKYSAPSGSLLVYIDNHYEKPEMQLDRTLGTEVNILSAINVFNQIKPYVHFKSFDRKHEHIPSKHGDFNNCPFWRESFWNTDTEIGTTGLNCYPEKWLDKEN